MDQVPRSRPRRRTTPDRNRLSTDLDTATGYRCPGGGASGSAESHADQEAPNSGYLPLRSGRCRGGEGSRSVGVTPQLWETMAGLGWLGVLVPESAGGLGLGLVDMVVLQ